MYCAWSHDMISVFSLANWLFKSTMMLNTTLTCTQPPHPTLCTCTHLASFPGEHLGMRLVHTPTQCVHEAVCSHAHTYLPTPTQTHSLCVLTHTHQHKLFLLTYTIHVHTLQHKHVCLTTSCWRSSRRKSKALKVSRATPAYWSKGSWSSPQSC